MKKRFGQVSRSFVVFGAGLLMGGFVWYVGFYSPDPSKPSLFFGSKAGQVFRYVGGPPKKANEEVLPPPEVQTVQEPEPSK